MHDPDPVRIPLPCLRQLLAAGQCSQGSVFVLLVELLGHTGGSDEFHVIQAQFLNSVTGVDIIDHDLKVSVLFESLKIKAVSQIFFHGVYLLSISIVFVWKGVIGLSTCLYAGKERMAVSEGKKRQLFLKKQNAER